MKRQSLWLGFLFILISGAGCYKNEPVPAADFSFSGDNEFHAPCLLIFQNKSQNASSFLWDFGDDSTSIASAPSHSYLKAGTYLIRLRAYTESRNEWATAIKPVTVNPPIPSH
jgi:hypothetical protein